MFRRSKVRFLFCLIIIPFLFPATPAFSLDLSCADIGSAVDQTNAYAVPVFDEKFNVEYCSTNTWFSLDLKAGQGITIVLIAQLSQGQFNFGLFDAGGKEIAAPSNRRIYDGEWGIAEKVIAQSGTYYIQVWEYTGTGSTPAFGSYDLAVYNAWYNAGVADSQRDYYFTQSTARYIADGNYLATELGPSPRWHWYRFTAQSGTDVTVTVAAHLGFGSLDFGIFTADGREIAVSDDGIISDNQIGTATLAGIKIKSGVYYVRVWEYNNSGGTYDLAITGADADADSDGDGLFDAAEYHHGTDINVEDSDGDGVSDFDELAQGRSPLYATEYTAAEVSGAVDQANAVALPHFDTPFYVEYPNIPHWYKLDLQSGQAIAIELKAHLNRGQFNFGLFDAGGKEIAAPSNRRIYDGEWGIAEKVIAQSGTYYIQVWEYTGTGSTPAFGSYDLAVYNAWYNAGVADSQRDYYFTQSTARYIADGNYLATELGPSPRWHWYRFTAQSGTDVTVTVAAHLGFGSLDFGIFTADGREIAASDDGIISDNQIGTATLAGIKIKSGVYYVRVWEYNNSGGTYDLAITGADADADSDGDGLFDAAEYHHGTDINVEDSDGDGVSDFDELAQGRSPLYATEYTAAEVSGAVDQANAVALPHFDTPFYVEYPNIPHWYKLDLQSGQAIAIELKAHLNRGQFNFGLFDAAGEEIANPDNRRIYDGQRGIVETVIAQSGTYYIQVWEYTGTGSTPAFGSYDLAVYNAWYNAGVTDSQRDYYFTQSTARYIADGNYLATELGPDPRWHWYRFTAQSGTDVTVTVAAHVGFGSLDFGIFTADGREIAASDDGIISDNQIGTATLAGIKIKSGVYYVRVWEYNNSGGTYDLAITGADADADSDGDGLFDAAEYHHGTDINVEDSDGDGVSDFDELAQGRSPLYATEYTAAEVSGAVDQANAVALPHFDTPFYVEYPNIPHWYKLDLQSGQAIAIELKAHLNRGQFNFGLFDAAGEEIANPDNRRIYDGQRGIVETVIAQSGTYYIQVWEYTGTGSTPAFGSYDLAVYNAWYNAGVTDSQRDYYFTQSTARYIADGNYLATELGPDPRWHWYRFTAQSGTDVTVTVAAHVGFGSLDFGIFTADGREIAASDDGIISDNQIGTATLAGIKIKSGVYYVRVWEYNNSGGTYDLAITGADADADSDGDGLFDAAEYHHGTDINVEDSDGDGVSDFDELAQGRSPLYATEYTAAEVSGAVDQANAVALPHFDTPFYVEYPNIPHWYKLDLQSGQAIAIELKAHLNRGQFNFGLFDAAGEEIANPDNRRIYDGQRGIVETVIAQSGTYYIQVWEYTGTGSTPAFGSYDLAVYNAWYNAGVTDSQRDYYFTQSTARYIADGNYLATELGPDPRWHWYRFTAQSGTDVTVTVAAHVGFGSLDFGIFTADGREIAASDDGIIGDNQIGTATLAGIKIKSGVYYVRVWEYNNSGGTYDLAITGADADADSDGDGLFDAAEYHHGTDINVEDSDGDGVSDFDELAQGRNPNIIFEYSIADVQSATSMGNAVPIPYFDKSFSVEYPQQDTWFALDLVAGQNVTVVLTAHLLRDDLDFGLYDEDGFELVGSNDGRIFDGETGIASKTVHKNGTYYIKVTVGNIYYSAPIGKYDLAVYKAWHHPGVTDIQRSFYSTINTARYIQNGNYSATELGAHWYRFTAQANTFVAVSVAAHLGFGALDFGIFDSEGIEISGSDDGNIGNGQVGTANKTVRIEGVYYVKVWEYNDSGGTYDLAITGADADADTDGDGLFDAAEYHHGTDIDLSDTDWDGTSEYDELIVGNDPTVAGEFTSDDVSGATSRINAFLVPQFDIPFSVEHPRSDTWYSMDLAAGQGITIVLSAHLNKDDLYFFLVNMDGDEIASASDNRIFNGETGIIEKIIPESGTYYIRVTIGNIFYSDPVGKYDLAVYNAWFNSGVADSQRDFYSSFYGARYVSNNSYLVSPYKKEFYRFSVQENTVLDIAVSAHLNRGSLDFGIFDQSLTEIGGSNDTQIFGGETGTASKSIITSGIYYLKVWNSNDATGYYDLSISGHDAVANIFIDPQWYNFGNVNTGDQAEKIFSISNGGELDLLVEDLTVDGDADFTLTSDNCSQLALSHLQACTFTVQFSPINAGEKNAIIHVPSNNPNRPVYDIPVSGTGVIQIIDTDGDGMTDAWETANGLNPNDPHDAVLDFDNDGLTNLEEYDSNTNPNNPDSDGDGMPDGWEVNYGLDPTTDDSALHADSDGLSNGEEYQYRTDPTNDDTDGDGISDGDEVAGGTNPLAMTSSLISDVSDITLSLGASRTVILQIENTRRGSDTFDLAVSGIDPGWYALGQTSVTISAGEVRDIPLEINIPEECGLTPLDYVVQVSAISPNTGSVTNGGTNIDLHVVLAPIISDLLPEDGELLGTNSIQIVWQTDVDSSTEVYYRVVGEQDYSQAIGDPGQLHRVVLDDLTWDAAYEWYAVSVRACETASSTVRTLNLQKGVVFALKESTHEILRDYDQQITIGIENRDVIEHAILVEVINPDEQLVAGFVGSGSEDEILILASGETQNVTLALHAQDTDTNSDQYTLVLKLSADVESSNPIVDYARATINVRDPVFDLVFGEINSNPAIFTNTYRITNNGDTLTDLSVSSAETIASQLIFQPKIEHLRLENGQSIDFTATFQPTGEMTQYDGLLTAKAAGQSVSINTHFGCEDGTSLYDVTLSNLFLCLLEASWYCTNRPEININLDVPPGIDQEAISRARLYINFSLKKAFGTYRKHDVIVKVNGTIVETYTDTIPVGAYAIEIPPSLIRTGEDGVGRNQVTLETRHMNGGHYAIASDFQLILDVDTINFGSVCAISQQEADQAALDIPYICDGNPQWQPFPRVANLTSLDESGSEESKFNPGETAQFRLLLTNPDLNDHSCDLTFIVDDNFSDGVTPFEHNYPFTILAGGSQIGMFWWSIPEYAGVGFYDAKAILSCPVGEETETVYDNVFAIYEPATGFEVNPAAFDFGEVGIGSSAEKQFTVTNTGEVAFGLGDVTIGGDPDFTIIGDGCSQTTLSPAESCTFTVNLTPQSAGNKIAEITVHPDDTGQPAHIAPLAGLGVDLSYVSPRLLTTQWEQYKFEYNADNEGASEEYFTGCTAIAVGQLVNYYMKKYPTGWLDRLLENTIVYPRFELSGSTQPFIVTFEHPGCPTLDSYPDTHPDGLFPVSTDDPCSLPTEDPLINFLWNVALGLDPTFDEEEGEGTGVLSYGAQHEPYDWVGDSTQQKIKSLLFHRFRFNKDYKDIVVSGILTRLDAEKDYIIESINSGHPVLISMYGQDGNGDWIGHTAVLDQYRVESNGDFQVKINMGWGPERFANNEASAKWYAGDGAIDAIASIPFTEFYLYKNTRPNIVDSDRDGMPNDWEQRNDLNPFDNLDAGDDADSDGLTNLDEYLNSTDPNNPDTDGDGVTDGDEIIYGTDPLKPETISINLRNKDVVVSLTGNNKIYVEMVNRYLWLKSVQFELTQLDPSWYTISTEDQNFTLLPFEHKIITIQLHLPPDCNIPVTEHPFSVNVSWEHAGNSYSSIDTGNLKVTPNPNVYTLAIPQDISLAGNTIFAAWRTDIPADSYLYYKKLGDEAYTEVAVATDATEHRAMLEDLDFFTAYEFYTESRSGCGGLTRSDDYLVKTGKAVKFVDNINEFWIDRDSHQPVTLTITNTDLIEHTFQLSVINNNEDIIVDFVGDGSNGREATLAPGASTDVELVIHAPDAQKTLYDIYLEIVSDKEGYGTFVDYSHAILHVRPFVANLDLQPVASTPGLMTTRFRLINYGDTLSDIEVYVDEDSRTKTWLNPEIHHYRLVLNPTEPGEEQWVEFDIHAQEYTTGTVYVRSGNDVLDSATFEIGCPSGDDPVTYPVYDLSVEAHIQDWYCTNKQTLRLPFAVPNGFGQDQLTEAALQVNFTLPMSYEKYDPHTVKIYINKDDPNGGLVDQLENTIPQGTYTFRIPKKYINLADDAPAQNIITIETEGIGVGQYIVAADFRIILNISEMAVNVCVPNYTPPPPVVLPPPETKIVGVGPDTKFRPGNEVEVYVELANDDDKPHSGLLEVTLFNNSFDGEVEEIIYKELVTVVGGERLKVRFNTPDNPIYKIPEDADDIDYTIGATFENFTQNSTDSYLNRPAFYVRTPIVVLHGIMGSKLVEKDGLVDNVIWGGFWDGLIRKLPVGLDASFQKLECDSTGSPINQNITPTKVIKELLRIDSIDYLLPYGVDVFGGLEHYLDKYHLYQPHGIGNREDFDIENFTLENFYDEDIFYFVYDWRLDNASHSVDLKRFIDIITSEQTTGNAYSRVNIIAHSMGGLVVKSLLNNNPEMSNKLKKLIFVGTPHNGAVKAFSSLRYGDNDFGITDQVSKDVGVNISSSYQLLPSRTYFDYYPEGYYELNGTAISSYDQMEVEMQNSSFNMNLFDIAENLHDLIDSDSLGLPENTYNIVGCKNPTVTKIVQDAEEWSPNFGDGDETVPLKSALSVNIDAGGKYAAQFAEHSNLPSQKGVRLLIRSLLQGYETNYRTDLFHPVAEYSDGFCGLDEGIRIKWPPGEPSGGGNIDWPWVTCIDCEPLRYTGNGIYIGILGSDYRIVNEGVEIFIPKGSIYTLHFQGVDREYLNIKLELMTEGGVIKTYVFANLKIDIDGCGEVNFDLIDVLINPVLRIDDQCDGSFETEGVTPSYELDENQSQDSIAPVTAINITGDQGTDGWFTSDITVSLTATDEGGSGILATRYRFHNDEIFSDYSAPFQITTPGNHTITFYSIDRNLNHEIEKVVEIKIDNVPPQVSRVDDEGAVNLGTLDLSATVEAQAGISGLQDVQYSLGTSPGLTDVLGWTSAGPVSDIQVTGLSLVESCSENIYINVKAKNGAGVESAVVSSDGIIILESGGDPDVDTFINEAELAAGSNPCNELSIPKDTTTQLKQGFNMISIPAEVMFKPDLNDWLPDIGSSDEIEKVMVYDKQAGNFITLIPGNASNSGFTLQGGEALIVYAKQDKEINYTSALCAAHNLKQGTNLVGFACPPDGYTAFQLLNSLGSENIVSIQGYSSERGAFESAGFNESSQTLGIDFPITPGEGYFIFMKQEVVDFGF